MRKSIQMGAALLLAACATLPASAPTASEAAAITVALAKVPASDRIALSGAVATEIGIRLHCPQTPLALAALTVLRQSFDILLRPRVSAASADLVDRLRDDANRACGIVAVADPEPDEPPPGPTV